MSMNPANDPQKMDPERLAAQLGLIVREIDSALKTIAALTGPLLFSQVFLPGATESLSEVSSMTEEASQSIMSLIEEQLEIQKKMASVLHQASTPLTLASQRTLESLLSQDQQSTLRVMGALGFQDLVQQNLGKIGQSIQIVENKLLEVLMRLHWETGARTDSQDGRKLLGELYNTKVGDPSRQRVVDEILREYGV